MEKELQKHQKHQKHQAQRRRWWPGGARPRPAWPRGARLRLARLRPAGLLTSTLIHGVVLALAYPWAFLGLLAMLTDVIDPDLLGTRGGQRWAAEIGLTEAGGEFGSEDKALEEEGEVLRVEIVTLPSQGKDILAEHKTEEDSDSTKKEEAAAIGEEKGKTEEDQAVDKAQPSAPAQASADAAQGRARAQSIGRDIGGAQGIGGSDQKAIGQFVSGEEAKKILSGWTFVGTNGFADGSISSKKERVRSDINWRVYYRSDGYLYARFSREASLTPHGKIALREFWSGGRWWIKGNWLCQSIDKWFYGGEVCFEVRRKEKEMALYYASCWGVSRCYQGRLGPRGFIRPGSQLE